MPCTSLSSLSSLLLLLLSNFLFGILPWFLLRAVFCAQFALYSHQLLGAKFHVHDIGVPQMETARAEFWKSCSAQRRAGFVQRHDTSDRTLIVLPDAVKCRSPFRRDDRSGALLVTCGQSSTATLQRSYGNAHLYRQLSLCKIAAFAYTRMTLKLLPRIQSVKGVFRWVVERR